MEIVSGKYKGRKLIAPVGETRPTLARVKNSIFSMIDEYIRGYRIIDLFAGSGAMGLECVSRGAYQTVLVDNSATAEMAIKQNTRGMKENVEFLKMDYLAALNTLHARGEAFDIVFLDPPYASPYAQRAVDYMAKNDMISRGGIVVYEHLADKNPLVLPQDFVVLKSKKYADKCVDIIVFEE